MPAKSNKVYLLPNSYKISISLRGVSSPRAADPKIPILVGLNGFILSMIIFICCVESIAKDKIISDFYCIPPRTRITFRIGKFLFSQQLSEILIQIRLFQIQRNSFDFLFLCTFSNQ